MKICIVSRSIEKDYRGSFEFDQATALAEAGHDVWVLSLDLRSIRRKRKLGVEESTYKGVKLVKVSIPLGAIDKRVFFSIAQAKFSKVMMDIINKYGDFDIIHAHFLDNAYIVSNTIAKICTSAKFVVTEHTNVTKLKPYINEIYFESVVRTAYEKADLLITVSESLKKIIYEKYAIQSVVVNNIVNTDIFRYQNRRGREINDVRFCSVGNLTENKRMKLLVECFSKAFKNDEKYKLFICGDGSEKKNILKEIEILGCKNNVFMLGEVSRERIVEVFGETDIFVLLSRSETFGVAFIEAMATGMPVISTMSGGPEEFVTENVGILTPDDKKSIVDNMIKMSKIWKSFDGEQISEYVLERFSPAAIAKRLNDLYKETQRRKEINE